MVKVIIKRAECVSCGTCVDVCPAFFELGKEDTLSQIVEAYRTEGRPERGEAPQDLEECAAGAADLCPVQVIFVG